jgi:phytanoyl-CoA hydroxylase
MLTDTQRVEFETRGYAVLPGFKPAAEIAALRERALALVDDFDPAKGAGIFSTTDLAPSAERWFLESGDKVRCFFEEEAFDAEGALAVPKRLAINKIGHALHALDPVFARFSLGADIAALAQALGLERPRVRQSMFIFKQPAIGGEVRWHQDATYLMAEPHPVLGLWFALEDARIDNGCLWVQPGGHRGPLRERFVREGDRVRLERLDDTPWPGPGDAVSLEVDAGTVVAFHGLLPHYSAPNRSAVSRHAYTLHLADGRSVWSPLNWLRRPHDGVPGG